MVCDWSNTAFQLVEKIAHTHVRRHTRYKTMAISMNREFFWALA
jgi:hypothetical protein